MKKTLLIGVILSVALLMLLTFPATRGFQCAWKLTTPLPSPSTNHHCTVHDNKIYLVGGATPTPGEKYDRVLYASVQPDGHVDPDGWQYTTPLPPDDTDQSERANAPVVVYENWIYVLDGSAERPPHRIERDTVCFARINPDGSVGDWTWTTPMPYAGCEEAVQWNGRIYILAGWDGYTEYDQVWFAEIDQIDGTLSSWTQTTSLPREIAHGHEAVVHNGVIYFIGGVEAYPKPDYYAPEVYYGIIDETTGHVGEWIETARLPVGLKHHYAVVSSGDIFVMGGEMKWRNISDAVYKAHINPDGRLDSWEEYCVLPEILMGLCSAALNGRLYVIGGTDQYGNVVDTVYFITLSKSTKTFFNINPNPTTQGQTVTLKGVLIACMPLGNETVQLYARPIGGYWYYITSLTTDTCGVFEWQAVVPWTTPPNIYIFAVYYPGSEMYDSCYNFDVLVVQ